MMCEVSEKIENEEKNEENCGANREAARRKPDQQPGIFSRGVCLRNRFPVR